jgi:Cu/Zn superoxide dismutase
VTGVFADNRISLLPGDPNNIVGRSIVLSDGGDDEGCGGTAKSLIDGSEGQRIVCANIYYIYDE